MRKNFVMLGVTSLTVASVWGTGCLEVRGGLAREADTVGSTDTTGTDVSETTPSDADLCAGKSCDDGNPCTEDHCSPATGTCEHLTAGAGAAVPAEPYECTSAANCDDNNPCTIDTCNIRQCSAGGFCTHASSPECPVGCSNGCDDGNPCTDDACVGEACEHAVLAECDPQCTSVGLLPVRNAWLAPWGSAVKALGTVQMGRTSSLSCMDDGLCNCWGAPVLEGFMSELGLYVSNQDETAMWCRSHDAPGTMGATTDVTCEPMAAAVDYRVWGIGGAAGSTPSAGASGTQPLPPPRIQGIAVEGYCLDTADLALTGRYQMFFERWGQTAELKAEIAIDEPGWLYLHVQGALCANCPPIDTWSVLEVLDNGIRFKFDARFDDWNQDVAAVARLASVNNALTGRWVLEHYAAGPIFTLHGPAAGDASSAGAGSASTPAPPDSDGVVDPYYDGGAIRLVRLPGDDPRSPCEWLP